MTTQHAQQGKYLYSRFAFPALLGVFIIFCAARAYAGFYGVLYYPHDAFALLDPAWRILNGQRPHINFYSQLGPFPFLQTALGLIVSHNEVQGMVYGQVITGFVLAVWTFFLAASRMASPFRYLLSLYVLLLVIAPYNIGESFTFISAGMTYNRVCYALTIVVLVESLLGAKYDGRRELPAEVSTGVALALLLFSKITFFVAAVFLVMSLFFVYRQQKSRLVGIAAGFSLVSFTFLAFLRFDFQAILRDYRMSAAAKHIGPTKILSAALNLVSAESLTLVAFVFLYGVIAWTQRSRSVVWRQAAAGAVVLIAGSFLLFGNFQLQGLPLNLCFLLFLTSLASRESQDGDSQRNTLLSGLRIWAIVLALGAIVVDASSLLYGVFERVAGHIAPMEAAGLRQFRIRDTGYSGFVDDGIALANQYRRPGDMITSLDFSDFYSYALRIPSPPTGAFNLHFGSTFNDRSHPDPEWLLSPVNIVMVPIHYSENGSQLSIPRIYGPYLYSHFHLQGSSQQWKLYRRNQS